MIIRHNLGKAEILWFPLCLLFKLLTVKYVNSYRYFWHRKEAWLAKMGVLIISQHYKSLIIVKALLKYSTGISIIFYFCRPHEKLLQIAEPKQNRKPKQKHICS